MDLGAFVYWIEIFRDTVECLLYDRHIYAIQTFLQPQKLHKEPADFKVSSSSSTTLLLPPG